MLTSLDHIVVAVRDLDAATELYGRFFGRSPSWRGEHPSYGTANTLFRLENTYVELLSPHREAAIADRLRARLGEGGDGLFALAFGTPDADECARELAANGLSNAGAVDGSGRDSASGVERRWRNVMLEEGQTHGVMLFAIEHRSAPDLLPFAAPLEAEVSAVSGCDHVVVNTTEPDRSIELFGKRLGLRLALDKEFPAWGMRLLFFRVGGITVEVAAQLNPEQSSPTDRLWGVSYRTRDIDRLRERLLRNGLEVSEVRVGRKPGTRVATVHAELCGVATLLIEHDWQRDRAEG